MGAAVMVAPKPNGNTGVTLKRWRTGHHRTAADTMRHMAEVVRDSVSSPVVWATADRIVKGVEGHDVAAQLAAINAWVAEHTQFVRDPLGLELLRSPEIMLRDIAQSRDGRVAGDCDDVAMLSAALAQAVGIRAAFVAEAYGRPDAPFSHVYAVALGPDGWVHFDVQRPAGVTLPVPTRRLRVEV